METNCLIIAGEKSGEEHALSFFDELKELCPDTHFWGVGGDAFRDRNVELHYQLKEFSSWGFSEVILKIPFYLRALRKIRREVKRRGCKTAILIDFQDFNLTLARKLKRDGVKVLYYVAPQAWAWKKHRVHSIQKVVHTLFTILPFEKNWWQSRGVNSVIGVAHPLAGHYGKIITNLPTKLSTRKKQLLLLPGSRNFEVKNLLNRFIKVAQELKEEQDIEIVLVKSPNVDEALYRVFEEYIDKVYSSEKLELALSTADLAIAASGTVTLATALFSIPTVVCFRTSMFNELIYETFISYTGNISLANIVHDKKIFPELIQDKASVKNIKSYIARWIDNDQEFNSIRAELDKTIDLLKGDQISVANYIGKVLTDGG